jgi:SNF2 family DNA or RNA helicase
MRMWKALRATPKICKTACSKPCLKNPTSPPAWLAPRPCISNTRPSTSGASSGYARRCSRQVWPKDLSQDTAALLELLRSHGRWDPQHDQKLIALHTLVTKTHGKDKVLIFTQFADTARYLAREIGRLGVTHVGMASGASADPYAMACRFSPKSNNKTVSKAEELRVLICTDVLSEGQNLQDCNVVVNFDLPWAIIRLIQRAGRVDRIGQRAEEIHCYSFLPTDGVENLILLRARIRQRLLENAEVVGTDEAFFEGRRSQHHPQSLHRAVGHPRRQR